MKTRKTELRVGYNSANKHIEPGIKTLKAGSMGGGRGASGVGDEIQLDEVWGGSPRYINTHRPL